MKTRIQKYILENFDDLLALDMKIARILGAPSPHTLSSYAYLLAMQGNAWGKFCRFVIDKFFKWIFNQEGHCKFDYDLRFDY